MIPLISIIIPTYNRAHMLGETLDSIKSQTFTDWECLVVDDGSSDDTATVVGKYVLEDARFSYLKRPEDLPKGANSCRNFGLDQSRGQYIQWFDSDDLMVKTKLHKQLSLLDNSNYDYCVAQTTFIDTNSGEDLGVRNERMQSENPLPDFIQFKIFWLTGAVLWKKDFLMTSGLRFDPDLQQAQDYDFHIRALGLSTNYIAEDSILMRYKCHGDNMSVSFTNNPQKIWSNARVKEKILNNYTHILPDSFIQKKYEELLAQYKLCLRKNYLKEAKRIARILDKSLDKLNFTPSKKRGIRWRIGLVYISLGWLKRGDNLLKNRHVFG
ncbi:glycosyltransferase family 2 protein [Aureitalea marina]|uniref:Glycosyltransferase 2-like domain-containing protein n=1 Tax=Aureitalea marina TaxID=930804 RepID=A0A2S7KMM6_9FLAO|nr:glycosyltransferase family 2 protein [Aureitalea marina]PQB03877.1 hypothetical protein BST85_02370 [Aureitalea marina]